MLRDFDRVLLTDVLWNRERSHDMSRSKSPANTVDVSPQFSQETTIFAASIRYICSRIAWWSVVEEASLLSFLVLPLDMVDNSISLCKHPSGWFFRHWAARTGHLILEWGFIRLLLLALSPVFPMAWHCNRIWLEWLSSGKRRQWAREHLARRPSSVRSPGCQSFRTLPVALCYQLAPSLSWLHERYP
jgi:hypothetical protein